MNKRVMSTKQRMCTAAALTLALLVGLVVYGCPAESVEDATGSLPITESSFTLTGLASSNGNYAFIREKGTDGNFLFGMAAISGENIIKGTQITDGAVEIPLYLYNTSDSSLGAFEASGIFSSTIKVYVSSQEDFIENDIIHIPTYVSFTSVDFSNGNASKTRQEGTGTLQ